MKSLYSLFLLVSYISSAISINYFIIYIKVNKNKKFFSNNNIIVDIYKTILNALYS